MSKMLIRPNASAVIGPLRIDFCPTRHQSSDTYTRPPWMRT